MPAGLVWGWRINIARLLWSSMFAARFVLLASAIVAGGLLSRPFPSRSMGYPARERQSALHSSVSIEPQVLEPSTTPPAAQAVALAVESATAPSVALAVEPPVEVPEQWVCVAGGLYGRLSNQLLAVGQALSRPGVGLQIDTRCRSLEQAAGEDDECYLFQNWGLIMEPTPRVRFGSCVGETTTWERLYSAFLERRGDAGPVPPLPSATARLQVYL